MSLNSEIIQVLVSPELHKMTHQVAKEKGLSASAYVRTLILKNIKAEEIRVSQDVRDQIDTQKE